jgi:hypothetical protein
LRYLGVLLMGAHHHFAVDGEAPGDQPDWHAGIAAVVATVATATEAMWRYGSIGKWVCSP